MRSRKIQLSVVAVFGVLLSIVLVVLGFPETTSAQSLMLELSALPLAVSLAAGDLMLLERAVKDLSPGDRIGLTVAAFISGVGLAMVILSFPWALQPLAHFGQFLIFVGLLVVLVVALRLQERPRSPFVPFDESDAEEPPAPTPARSPKEETR